MTQPINFPIVSATNSGMSLAPSPGPLVRYSYLSYLRMMVTSLGCVCSFVLLSAIGFAIGGVAAGIAAGPGVLAAAIAATRFETVRRYLTQQAQFDARNRREAQRLARLPSGFVDSKQQYVALRDLVEQLERTHPMEAARFELQDLLDQFIRLVCALHASAEAVMRASANDGSGTGTNRVDGAAPSPRLLGIRARRLRHRDECRQRGREIADGIEQIDELIRLVVLRSAVSAIDLDAELTSEVERRLWELDELDAALEQLTDPSREAPEREAGARQRAGHAPGLMSVALNGDLR